MLGLKVTGLVWNQNLVSKPKLYMQPRHSMQVHGTSSVGTLVQAILAKKLHPALQYFFSNRLSVQHPPSILYPE